MISIEKLTEKLIVNKGIKSWPIRLLEVCNFRGQCDMDDLCSVFEGDGLLSYREKEYKIEAFDFVKFLSELKSHLSIDKVSGEYYQFAG